MITTPVNRDNRAEKVLINPARILSRSSSPPAKTRDPIFATCVAAGLWKHSGVHGWIEEDLSRLLHAAVKSYFRPALSLSLAPRVRMAQVMRVRPLFRVLVARSNNLIYSTIHKYLNITNKYWICVHGHSILLLKHEKYSLYRNRTAAIGIFYHVEYVKKHFWIFINVTYFYAEFSINKI